MPSLRIRYQTIEFHNVDIHVRTLWDTLQYSDTDNEAENLGISSATWPYFGVIWPSGEVLAHHMIDYDIAGKRILEVGCGIGLASLILNHRLADITSTDYHPEVGRFLTANVNLNNGRTIPFVRTGWSDSDRGLGSFDLIIGSDLLYEQDNVAMLSGFIERHTKPHCSVIIVDPGRGQHPRFSRQMIAQGYSHTNSKPADTAYLSEPFKGQIMSYSR